MRLILSTSPPGSIFAACLTITKNILNSQKIKIFRRLQRIPNKDKCRNEDVVWCDYENCGGLGSEVVGRCQGGGCVIFRTYFTYRHLSLILPVFTLLLCLGVTSVRGDACWQGLQNAKNVIPLQLSLYVYVCMCSKYCTCPVQWGHNNPNFDKTLISLLKSFFHQMCSASWTLISVSHLGSMNMCTGIGRQLKQWPGVSPKQLIGL